jgi:hypothetical protein
MATQKSPGEFRPWTSNLIWTFYGLVVLVMAWHFLFTRGHLQAFLIAAALCSGFTVWHWSQFIRRSRGKRVEIQALVQLSKIVTGRTNASLIQSVPLPYGGDADAVLILSGVKFALEIKSIEQPRKVSKAHLVQARKAAHCLYAIPVVWLPMAKTNEARETNGVQIFGGQAKSLVKFLEQLK